MRRFPLFELPLAMVAGCLLGAIFAGCTLTTPAKNDPSRAIEMPMQGEAMRIVWRETYGRTDGAPVVRWVLADKMTCKHGGGTVGVFDGFESWGRCVAGVAYAGVCVVAWYDGGYAVTAFAHELVHAFQERDSMLYDDDHKTPPFQPGGLVERANAALRAAGL